MTGEALIVEVRRGGEVGRGGEVESVHEVWGAVCAGEGASAIFGDGGAAVFPRSAIKSFQAMGFWESGAMSGCGATTGEAALACASHSGESEHVGLVRDWLGRLGLDEGDLACGAHAPYSEEACLDLARAGEEPGRAHNNCSGKHAAFLATALHKGWEKEGYEESGHEVQRAARGYVEEFLGEIRAEGVDGCGAPAWAFGLVDLARGAWRFAAACRDEGKWGRYGDSARQMTACAGRRPFLIGGSGRFDTAALEALDGRGMCKSGAEGVFTAMLPGLGIGAVFKARDGSKRAAETVGAAFLEASGEATAGGGVGGWARKAIYSAAGKEVGGISVAGEPSWGL